MNIRGKCSFCKSMNEVNADDKTVKKILENAYLSKSGPPSKTVKCFRCGKYFGIYYEKFKLSEVRLNDQ